MTSPCKDCQRRTLGCHSADMCPEWQKYEEAKLKKYAMKMELGDHAMTLSSTSAGMDTS